MAVEPINIFSHRKDLAGIAALLRRIAPGIKVVGPDNCWERIVVEVKKSFLGRARKLVFKNSPDYYEGPDWSRQVAGMEGYFSRFPEAPRKAEVLRHIRSFQFALATEFEPELSLESKDPRLELLFAVVRQVDGVIFTPSRLWDAAGRPLLCANGNSNPAAVLPAVPPVKEDQALPTAPGLEESEEEVPEPPEARRVALRALCLAAVAGRGLLEAEKMPQAEKEKIRHRLMTWTGELALETELEVKERNLVQQAVGTLPRQALVNATWQLEGLGVLAWALGNYDLPAYDQMVDAGVLFPAIGFLDLNEATPFLNAASLRSHPELETFKQQCFALHWRLRDFSLKAEAMDFRSFARKSWFGPLDVSAARFCGDDLAVGEVAIARAPEDAFRTALGIIQERHQAINWLVKGGRVYSETDTST